MSNVFEQGLQRYLSVEQLQKIQSIKVGVGGAGGLGSNVAMILVRSGFRDFEILDLDVIEASNLNRQQYFLSEIGKSKVDTLKTRLKAINPDLHIVTHNIRWSKENASEFFYDCPVIVEAFDQAVTKHAFVEYYHPKARLLVSGNGMAGLSDKKPLQIKKMENLYMVGDYQTDTALGHPPMAPRVTACAAMMAEIVLDYALDLL